MEKSMTLNLRVNPVVKQQAEDVLKQLGIPMATAIDMYLRQIKLTGGIPFSVCLCSLFRNVWKADSVFSPEMLKIYGCSLKMTIVCLYRLL